MHKQGGFTLVEALTALTIILILGAVLLPGLQTLLRRGQDEAEQASMLVLLQNARSQSDIRHRTISICHSNDQHTCNGDWSEGQMIFVDDAEDGVVQSDEQIIEVHQMKLGTGRLHFKFYPRFRDYIQFHPLITNNNDNGMIWFCRSAETAPSWAIVINKSGEFRTLHQNREGRIDDSKGQPLSCT